MEKDSFMTRLDWVEESTQSVWTFCIKFDTWKEHWKMSVIEGKQCFSKYETVLRENHVNRESESLDLTIYFYICYDEHESPSSCNNTVYLSWWLHPEDFLERKVHRWLNEFSPVSMKNCCRHNVRKHT